MPIFQPTVPHYETIATKTIAHVESSGSGLLGLWPRPVYQGDTRGPASGEGGFLGGLFGGLFSAAQPAYQTEPPPPPAALLARSEKSKPER